jgi:hypothetical protein
MDRYGDDLEADFQQVWHLDLGELVRQGKIRKITNLIDRLPQASRFYAAVSDDEEHVRMILEAQEGQPKKTVAPPSSEWGSLEEGIAGANDRLDVIAAVLVAANGGKPPKSKPYQRPVSKFEEVRQAMTEEQAKSVTARVLRRRARVE